jgi:diadenosine tetraphosphate (Ap4A) HIT family hydrolase
MREGAMTVGCIFCNVTDDALVCRGADGIVILDDPIRPGHVLVGARTHGESLSDISEDDAAAVLRLANRVAKVIVAETGAAKVYVAAVGDKDKHFHVHLLPKMQADPNLGPYIFGEKGWMSFLPSAVDGLAVRRVSDAIRTAARC